MTAARAIAGEALRVAMRDALREIGVVEPVRLDIAGDRQHAVCRAAALAALELGGVGRPPTPVLAPLGRRVGERIAGLVVAALRGDQA